VPNILIIDDEKDVCEVLQTFLEGKGHRVETTTSAENLAVNLRSFAPDLILLDVLMPDANGLELLPQVKAETSGCPVIVITGLNDYRISDLLYEAGADSVIAKPIRLQTLDNAVNQFLNTPNQV